MPKTHYNSIKSKSGKFVKLTKKFLLSEKYPKLIKEWDFEKNKKITPQDISYKYSKSVHWKCKKNHTWTTSPYHRTISKSGCPYCARPTSKPEIRIYCELLKYFPDIKNRFKIKNKEIDVFLPKPKLAIEYDGYYYHKDRFKQDLNKNEFYKDNRIKLIRIREWVLPKTRNEDISGDKLGIKKKTMNSIFKILGDKKILDKKNVYSYIKKRNFINDILYTKIISELPAPPFKESLAYKFPNLSKEFDVEKNHPFKQSYFRPGSHTKVHWICKSNNDHKWLQTIKNRALLSSKCPKCRGFNYHKNVDYKKTLQFRSALLTKEFDLKKNKTLKPETITVNWPKPLFWVCGKNKLHKWKANIRNRFWNKTGCPSCARLNAVGRKLNYPMTKIRVLYNIKRTKDHQIKKKWIDRLKEFN